jgi:hypothetical protein
VVLSNGREVVGPGYSRVTGVTAKVTGKKENLGNHSRVIKIEQHYPSWVNRVSQNSNTDRQADRVSQVGRVTRVSPRSSTDRRIDQASQVSWVGSTEQNVSPMVLL